MISTTERRQGEPTREHARVPFAIPVELAHDERTPGFEADAVDLSAGGLSLRSTSLPEVGATLHCRFDTLPGGTRISGRGEVVWADPAGERSGEFGLRFTEIDPRAQALISEMIAERVATGGIGSPHQPRMATLEFEENEGPITAKLTRAMGRDVVFEQPLDVLALGRGVVAHADKTLGHGNILRVDLRMDNGTPTLALTVRFSEEQDEFGEYDWGEPESGTQQRTDSEVRALKPHGDTVPDLAAPLAIAAGAEDAAEGGAASRIATSAGGTLAPAQPVPSTHVATRSGGILAPTVEVAGHVDPLSPDATSLALARIAEQTIRQQRPEVGTPLAAALAASNARKERDTEPSGDRESVVRTTQPLPSSPGSDSAPGSIRAAAAQTSSAGSDSAPGSIRAALAEDTSAGADSAPGSIRAVDPYAAQSTSSPGAQLTAATDAAQTAPGTLSAAQLMATGDAVHAAAPGSERAMPTSLRPYAPGSQRASVLDTVPHQAPARRTRPMEAKAPRDTDPDEALEPTDQRATPPLDPRHTPVPGATPGLAGTRGKGAKQMDLTFAGDEEEEDFTDADEYEMHADDDQPLDYDAIAVLESETLSDPDDVRHTDPYPHGVRREPASSPSYAGTASSSWGPTDTARRSPLVRFLRFFAAIVDRMQVALGFGSRALKRASSSVVPVLRRQLARRSTLRGVGSRARRSAGAPTTPAPTGWKLPRGSGRLVLLAILMIGCGVLLVYAFPQNGDDQIDLHREVRAEGEEVEAAHATETAASAVTTESDPAAAVAATGAQLGTAKQPLTAANPAKPSAKPAARADDKVAGAGAVFGHKQVPNSQKFVLRTSNPITTLHGKSDPGGFTVILPNTRALDKAAPIALANPAVARAKILNKSGYAELNVRFAEGRSPAYRVSAQQAGLEVLIGQ